MGWAPLELAATGLRESQGVTTPFQVMERVAQQSALDWERGKLHSPMVAADNLMAKGISTRSQLYSSPPATTPKV